MYIECVLFRCDLVYHNNIRAVEISRLDLVFMCTLPVVQCGPINVGSSEGMPCDAVCKQLTRPSVKKNNAEKVNIQHHTSVLV